MALSCWTSNGTAYYTNTPEDQQSRLKLPAGVDASLEEAALIIMLHRLVAQHRLAVLHEAAINSNDSRRVSMRLHVGAIYSLLIIASLTLAVMAAVFLAWALPLRAKSTKLALLMWLGLLVAVLLAVSLTTGLVGWISIASLLALTIVANAIAAAVISKRNSNKQLPNGSVVTPLSSPVDPEKSMVLDTPTSSPSSGRAPASMSRWQIRLALGCLILLVVILILLPALAASWTVKPYLVWDRAAGNQVEEFQPQGVAKALGMAYSFDRLATTLKLGWMLRLVSDSCGVEYSKELTEAEKEVAINQEFVEKYSINMSLYSPSDYRDYSTVNEWFSRPLAPGTRPIAPEPYVTSPAHARIVVYPEVPDDLQVWLKSQYFSVEELLHGDPSYQVRR
eukprot:scaffold190256_cov32-Prasinocladus_malaysianus.AAC.2